MRYSLSTFVYFNYSLEDALRLTAEAGYAGVDVWGGRPHAYREDLTEADCDRLRELLDRLGLAVASFIPAQFRYPTSLCSPIDRVREDSVAYIQAGIERAAWLGAPLVSVCPGHTLRGQSRADGLERLRASLTEICGHAARRGLRVALEPADAYETDLANTVAEGMAVVNAVGLDNLGIVLDTGHVRVTAETMEAAFASAGERLFHVHVDDNHGQRDQHLIPGEGAVNFSEVFALLEQHQYQGFLCAELAWDYTLDPEPAARETLARLKTFAGG